MGHRTKHRLSDAQFLRYVKHKRVLTTGEVARALAVATRTVSNWYDSGLLKGWRVPGTRDRRFAAEVVREFMGRHGMPLGDLFARPVVLVASPREDFTTGLASALGAGWEVVGVRGPAAAGAMLTLRMPEHLIIDYALGTQHCKDLLTLSKQCMFPPLWYGIATEDQDGGDFAPDFPCRVFDASTHASMIADALKHLATERT